MKKELIEMQNDLLRILENAKQKKIDVVFGKNPKDYDIGFFVGCAKSFEYAYRHLTNVIEKFDKDEQLRPKDVDFKLN